MVKEIHAILTSMEFTGQSETIEFAKGMNDINLPFWKRFKRRLKWQLKKS